MTDERAEQILNNVTEEFVDLKQTGFATKNELCEAILFLLKREQVEIDAHSVLKNKLLLLVLEHIRPVPCDP